MKVSYILMQFPTPRETFATNQIVATENIGVDISVHSFKREHISHARLVEERNLRKLKIYSLTTRNYILGLFLILSNPALTLSLLLSLFKLSGNRANLFKSIILIPRAFSIAHEVKVFNPDVLHLYWGHYPAIVSYIVKKKLPDILISHGFVAYDILLNYKFGFREAQSADLIFTICKADYPYLRKMIPNKEFILSYHGLDEQLLDRFSIQDKVKFKIITAGALTKEKKTLDAINVFEKVAKKWPKCELVLLGDGPERSLIQNYINNNNLKGIRLLGHIDYEQVFMEMASANVFLSMSQHNERIPNVVKEAILQGCICVITESPGIRELVTDNSKGFVVLKGEIKKAAEIIDRIYSDSIDIKGIRENAFSHLRQTFKLQSIVTEQVEIWRQAINLKSNT